MLCQQDAQGAGFTSTSNIHAWLSNVSGTPASYVNSFFGPIQTADGTQVAQSTAADQAALVAAAEHFLRVFDNLEFEPFEVAWSSSRSVFFPFRDTPERVEGAAVGERFRQFFAEVRSTRPGPPYLHLEPRELRAEVIGDGGLVTFMLGRAPGEVSRRTAFFVRERGAWKLRHLHASNMPAAEPPK